MAILKDAWQLYNSLTLCDDSKKGVRTELRRWELHLSHLEQREISSIKKLDLARLRCHLEKKNLSPQTIYHCLSLLRRVLYTAKEYELSDTKLPSFPMSKVKNQRYRFLSIDEANMLIACLSNRKFFSSMLWRDLPIKKEMLLIFKKITPLGTPKGVSNYFNLFLTNCIKFDA